MKYLHVKLKHDSKFQSTSKNITHETKTTLSKKRLKQKLLLAVYYIDSSKK